MKYLRPAKIPRLRRVLYGISPIGLGHATRAAVIIKLLNEAGVDVRIVSGGKVAEFLSLEGFRVENVVSDPGLRVSKGEMKGTLWWYIRSWRALRETLPRVGKIADEYSPSLFVGDEEFSSVSLGLERGIPSVFVTDELELGFARNPLTRSLEGRVLRWYNNLLANANLVVVPDVGRDHGNFRYVGPVVRPFTRSSNEVDAEYGLPTGGHKILFSMSGSGIGDYLMDDVVKAVDSINDPQIHLVIVGNRGRKVRREGVFDLGVIRNGHELIGAADLVISTAGKSTIDEASCYGTPMVAIPIRNHAEQERNAAALGFTYRDRTRLPELIRENLGRRHQPLECDGGGRAAKILEAMLPADA